MGRWIENGSGADAYKPLDDFRAAGNGRNEYVLKNLHVYFWRWGTWKVFDANANIPDGDAGIVCYISHYMRITNLLLVTRHIQFRRIRGHAVSVEP